MPWLRKNDTTMDHDQRLKYSQAVAAASDARDKCLAKLGLSLPDSNDDDGMPDPAAVRARLLDIRASQVAENAAGATPENDGAQAHGGTDDVG